MASQIVPVGAGVVHRAHVQRGVAVLLDGAPAGEARVEEYPPHRGKVDVSVTEIAEDPLAAGIIEAGARRDHPRLHRRVDILEVHVADPPDMARHEGDRVEAGVGMVPGVEADLQDVLVHLVQEPLQLRLEVDEAGGMGVDADGQAVVFRAHAGHGRDPVAKRGPFRCVHLLRVARAPGGGGAARRDGIDQHKIPRAMGGQRLAGPHRPVHHVVPLRGIVERAEDHPADQFQAVLGERVAEHRGILRHEADGSEFDAGVARGGAVAEHAPPRRVAGVVGEFHAPGAGGIADSDGHGLRCLRVVRTEDQKASSESHCRDDDEAAAAATTRLTSMPSRNVGQTGSPVSMARRKSRASMMIWS